MDESKKPKNKGKKKNTGFKVANDAFDAELAKAIEESKRLAAEEELKRN